MGKYNFSAMKFDEIEKRITGLEASCARLEAENIRLREENETLKGKTCQTRDLTHEIEDYSAEWKVATEMLNAIVDTIYYAKIKMAKESLVEQS